MSELIDREALKDAVRRYAGEPIKVKDKKCQAICLDMLGTIDSQLAASTWHRVEEPPKEYGNYIAVVNGEVMEVTYSDMRDDWKWSTCDADGFVWIRSELVTHWMPLPEPPKEEEE